MPGAVRSLNEHKIFFNSLAQLKYSLYIAPSFNSIHMKKVQPNYKSIVADPRVKELWFEGGGRRPGQSAYDADDRWWLTYEDGYVCTENHTRTTNSYTLRDIASMINSSCMSIEEYKREFPGFAIPG